MKNKQLKYDLAYLKMAEEWSKLSYCKRRQVGAPVSYTHLSCRRRS